MAQPVLVRGHLSGWSTVLRFSGPVALVVAAIVFLFAPPLAIVIGAIGVVATLLVEVSLWQVRRSRVWVEDTQTGFRVTSRAGVREYRDQQAIGLGYYHKRVYAEGVLKSSWRYFLVWFEGEPAPLELINPIPVGQADPLGELIGRLLENSKSRAEEAIHRGSQASGEGWALDQNYLTVPATPLPEQLRFDDISAIDIFDDKLCVWRRGQDEAVAKLPVASRNAHLLQMLLATRVVERTEDPNTVQGEGLGRVLFERKPNRALVVFLWLVVPVGVLAGFACLAFPDSLPVGIGILLVTPLIGLGAAALQASRFRCHERGVQKKGLFGTQNLPYSDVAAFTYSATRHYHNGAYVGTNLALRFDPRPGVYVKPVGYNTTVQAADDALDALRDHISRFLASRMAEDLSQGQVVPWTNNLSYTTEGIVYRPGGFLGRKEPVLLPYSQFGGYDFQQGKFRLWAKNNPKPIVTEQASQKNFYPGYYMLLEMFYSGSGTTA